MSDTPISPLIRVPQTVAALSIVDGKGELLTGKFALQHGANEFGCLATYIDGSQSLFAAYWTCPLVLRGGGVDLWGVLGKERRERVTIHANVKHERYTELAVWAFQPSSEVGRNDFPKAYIGFDYVNIDALKP